MEPHKRAAALTQSLHRDEVHIDLQAVHPQQVLSFQGYLFVNQFFRELAEIERRIENGITL